MTEKDLTMYDFVLMIDKSGSMGTNDCKGGKTRWQSMQEQTLSLARKMEEFDDNGIDVVVFDGQPKFYYNTTSDKVAQIFKENQPSNSTDTAVAIKAVLDSYFEKKSKGITKPIIVLCVTDGEADDKRAVVKVIVEASNKIQDENEIGISFIQIGNDNNAAKFLQFLDDELVKQGAKFDIVDCKTTDEMQNMTLNEVLYQAIEG